MPWYFWTIGIVTIAALLAFPLPKRIANRKVRPRNKYAGSQAVMFGINEVFHPSAQNASLVMEEKREAKKANPSPEDKPL